MVTWPRRRAGGLRPDPRYAAFVRGVTERAPVHPKVTVLRGALPRDDEVLVGGSRRRSSVSRRARPARRPLQSAAWRERRLLCARDHLDSRFRAAHPPRAASSATTSRPSRARRLDHGFSELSLRAPPPDLELPA
jgi:hypothetical protein